MMSSMVSFKNMDSNRMLQIAIIVSGLFVAILSGLLASEQPIIVVVMLAGLIISFVSLIKADLMTLIFFFIMVTNAAIISVKFHHVPYVVGAAFPLFLGIALVNYIVIRREQIIITPLMIPLMIYLLVELLGCFVAVNLGDALNELMSFVIEGFAIYFLIVNAVRSMKTLRRTIRVIMISVIFMSSFPIFQQVTKTYNNNYWGFAQVPGKGFNTGVETVTGAATQARLAGAIGEKNFFGEIMLMLGFITLPYITDSSTTPKKLLAAMATISALVVANLTFSRGVAIAFAATIIVATFLGVISRRQLLLMIIAAIALLLMFPQFMARLTTIQQVADYAAGANSSATIDTSTQGRATEMQAALIVFSEHPVIGVGPNQYRNYVADISNRLGLKRIYVTRQAHDFYLDIAANTGIVGLAAMLALIFMTLQGLLKVRKRWRRDYPLLASTASGFILAIISFLMNGMFLHFSYVRYFYMVLALSGSIIYISKQLDNKRLLASEKKKIGEPEPA